MDRSRINELAEIDKTIIKKNFLFLKEQDQKTDIRLIGEICELFTLANEIAPLSKDDLDNLLRTHSLMKHNNGEIFISAKKAAISIIRTLHVGVKSYLQRYSQAA